MRGGGKVDKARPIYGGSRKKNASAIRASAADEHDSCELELEAAIREVDLAIAEAERISASYRHRIFICEIAEGPPSRGSELTVAERALPMLL